MRINNELYRVMYVLLYTAVRRGIPSPTWAPPSNHVYRVPWAVAVYWCGLASAGVSCYVMSGNSYFLDLVLLATASWAAGIPLRVRFTNKLYLKVAVWLGRVVVVLGGYCVTCSICLGCDGCRGVPTKLQPLLLSLQCTAVLRSTPEYGWRD